MGLHHQKQQTHHQYSKHNYNLGRQDISSLKIKISRCPKKNFAIVQPNGDPISYVIYIALMLLFSFADVYV